MLWLIFLGCGPEWFETSYDYECSPSLSFDADKLDLRVEWGADTCSIQMQDLESDEVPVEGDAQRFFGSEQVLIHDNAQESPRESLHLAWHEAAQLDAPRFLLNAAGEGSLDLTREGLELACDSCSGTLEAARPIRFSADEANVELCGSDLSINVARGRVQLTLSNPADVANIDLGNSQADIYLSLPSGSPTLPNLSNIPFTQVNGGVCGGPITPRPSPSPTVPPVEEPVYTFYPAYTALKDWNGAIEISAPTAALNAAQEIRVYTDNQLVVGDLYTHGDRKVFRPSLPIDFGSAVTVEVYGTTAGPSIATHSFNTYAPSISSSINNINFEFNWEMARVLDPENASLPEDNVPTDWSLFVSSGLYLITEDACITIENFGTSNIINAYTYNSLLEPITSFSITGIIDPDPPATLEQVTVSFSIDDDQFYTVDSITASRATSPLPNLPECLTGPLPVP